MTNYARMYRFGITPWERYRAAAAASITALLDREETESVPAPSAVRSTSAADAVSTPPNSRGGGGRPWASITCRPR